MRLLGGSCIRKERLPDDGFPKKEVAWIMDSTKERLLNDGFQKRLLEDGLQLMTTREVHGCRMIYAGCLS